MRSFIYTVIYFALLAIVTTSCNTKSATKCTPCPLAAEEPPHINFRIIDKTTSQDLFFSNPAPYKFSDLKLHHLVNGSPDTIILHTDTAGKYFSIIVIPNHTIDTVTMQVANKPQHILLFNTSVTGGCCSMQVFNSVSYDGAIVYTPAKGPNVIVFAQ